MSMRMLSLFSGVGGIDLAAQWAGIETVAFCEIDPFCQKVLRKHWPDVPIFPDIKKLTKEVLDDAGIGRIDIVAGGFPCQPYSVAGKRRGKEDDRHLWPEMLRIISETRPAWVVGENVANFVNMELDKALSDLDSIGYTCQTFIIPACSAGADHERYRCFIVANSNCQQAEQQLLGYGECGRQQRKPLETREETIRQEDGTASNDNDSRFYQIFTNANSKRRESPERPGIPTIRPTESDQGLIWERPHPEPGVHRMVHGIPNRIHRLKSLGNAVVPQQIYPIFAAIAAIEGGTP